MPNRLAALSVRATASSTRTRLAVLALFAAAAAGVAALNMQPQQRTAPGPAATRQVAAPVAAPAQAAQAGPAPAPAAARRIYPYSIIPGGVSGREELAQAIKTDKLVAGHYAGFDVDKARPVVVTQPRAVYVSYRKDGKIYWTSKKLMLAVGETLLSDGRNEMRARCANRISDTPQLPVAAGEPSEAVFDAPVVEEGSIQQISAEAIEDSGFDGQAFQLQTFANGAGLAPAATASVSTDSMRFAMNGGSPGSLPPSQSGSSSISRTVVVRNPGTGTTDTAPDLDAPTSASPNTPGTGSSDPETPRPPTGGADSPQGEPKPEPDPQPFIPPPPLGQPEQPHDGADQTGPADVPEPGTLWLAGLAGAAMWLLRRRTPSV